MVKKGLWNRAPSCWGRREIRGRACIPDSEKDAEARGARALSPTTCFLKSPMLQKIIIFPHGLIILLEDFL